MIYADIRKLLAFFLLATIGTVPALAQSYYNHQRAAETFGRSRDYKSAVSEFRLAFSIRAGNVTDFYNAACFAALMGDRDLALEWLQSMIEKGGIAANDLAQDEDLQSLHADLRWTPTLIKNSEKLAGGDKRHNKELEIELSSIYDSDRNPRIHMQDIERKSGRQSSDYQNAMKAIKDSDAVNLSKVVRILDKYGWVGSNVVDAKASEALFLVIQHAPLSYQKKYIALLRDAVNSGEADASSLAMLEDRIAVSEDGGQIYGSQLKISETGRHACSPSKIQSTSMNVEHLLIWHRWTNT